MALKKSNLRVLMRGHLVRKTCIEEPWGIKKGGEKGIAARHDFKEYLAMQNYR